MSVLIEALTLVVPKIVLNVSYRGGADAYMHALLQLDQPPRYICDGDQHLINASFYDPDHMESATEMLEAHGIVSVDEDCFIEMACVDQQFGPTMPCDWLEFRRHRGGFSYAWLAGTEAGDMAAPDGLTPEQSRRLTRTDVREQAGRCLRLSAENGLETWLDVETGKLTLGLPQRDVEIDP